MTVLRIIRPSIIVMVDGGICSQMHQYLLSEIFKRRGIKVEYDLSFFKNNGRDLTGKHVRNFDLLKIFPHLSFTEASSLKLFIYKIAFKHIGRYPDDQGTTWTNLNAPRLLLGYYADPQELYYPLFQELFKFDPAIVLNQNDLELYNSIEAQNSIAIHVRRGDLANFVVGYGNPVTLEYFNRAISYFQDRITNPHFYIFSDDYEYIINELIPSLKSPIRSTIFSNKADKGYIDFIFISKCKHQITSKGSLGKYGALVNPDPDKIIIVSKDDNQTFMFNCLPSQIIKL